MAVKSFLRLFKVQSFAWPQNAPLECLPLHFAEDAFA